MSRHSLKLGDARALRITKAAALYEIDMDSMILRLLDLGLSALPPLVPRWHADLAEPDPLPEEAEEDTAEPRKDERDLEWRVVQCWSAYGRAWAKFYERHEGTCVPAPKAPPAPIRALLRKQLCAYDGELLGEAKREEWSKQSRVRAAGIGLFMDPWYAGISQETNGQRRLSPDYAWKQRAGKVDPILHFSGLYFTWRATKEDA